MDRDELQATADELLKQQKTPDRPKEIAHGTGTVIYKPSIGGPRSGGRVKVEEYARYEHDRRNQHIPKAPTPIAPTPEKREGLTPPVPPKTEEKTASVAAPIRARVKPADVQERRDQQTTTPTPAMQPKPEAKPEREIDAARFKTDPDYRREVLAKATQEITKERQQNANRQMERSGRER